MCVDTHQVSNQVCRIASPAFFLSSPLLSSSPLFSGVIQNNQMSIVISSPFSILVSSPVLSLSLSCLVLTE